MNEKPLDIIAVLSKVEKGFLDKDLQSLAAEVAAAILKNPAMGVGISTSDYESIVLVNPLGRQVLTTLGRLMTRHLGYDPNKYSLMIQNLTDAYLAEVRRSSVSFDVVSGEEITESYKKEWGAHSCMTGDASSYTRFLAENPKSVSILLFKDRTTKARALLWTTREDIRVLDRIYPNSGWHIEVIWKWAREAGVSHRISNSIPGDRIIALSNKKTLTVSIHNPSNIWSYMDTFLYGTKEKKDWYILSNSSEMDPRCSFTLTTTCGKPIILSVCHGCGKTILPGMACSSCYADGSRAEEVRCCADCARSLIYICTNCERRFLNRKDKKTVCERCEAEIKLLEKEREMMRKMEERSA